ncbi:DUF3298 and DUF4163 domain-containing protein [Paenibacillus macquariensis]|uniref:Anti-sigma factor n=1 Tax=Paenibacillus macquariensis TaxID=948756 RepID=A0ABY1KEZ5_9BACL|nr:DUF3298 and DUF4163 domain-containing protein [Paenibacillus macquariensis]MEC0094375.1 DUF3298 domain-containing protein [Paenibacillus macquariensis]OAB34974.1 anti-sigma factor [Paenibacillus macquariensis subsp. macquariensis]SIR73803.1 protein of unknown function [Paenibacillus macquariensis]
MNEKLEEMKNQYENTPIPKELDAIVKNALRKGETLKMKNKKQPKKLVAGLAVAGVAAAFILGVNTNQSFAASMKDVPVIGSIAKVVTFREFKVDEKTYTADIKAPAVKGLQNKSLEDSLNQKYLADAKAQYESFKEDMKYVESVGGGHINAKSGYDVKTNNDQILSIERYHTEYSMVELQFDTIDKKNNILITLPSLFKDDNYINAISENIKEQMNAQFAADPNDISYNVEGVNEKLPADMQIPSDMLFEKIKKDQMFYINKDGNLVIVFDKYEVGPGSTGTPEFVIPTSVINNDLVSSAYIK